MHACIFFPSGFLFVRGSWICKGFPHGSVVKNLPANTGDSDLNPELGRSLGEGNGNPLQYFPGKSHEQRSLAVLGSARGTEHTHASICSQHKIICLMCKSPGHRVQSNSNLILASVYLEMSNKAVNLSECFHFCKVKWVIWLLSFYTFDIGLPW